MAILYVIRNEILNPIVESQVFRRLAIESPPGDAFVVALLPLGLYIRPKHHSRVRETISRLSRQYGVKVYPSYARLSRCSVERLDALSVRRVITQLGKSHKQLEIRGRNAHATAIALTAVQPLARRPFVTYDCRGDEAAELLGKHGIAFDSNRSLRGKIDREFRNVTSRMAAACAADEIIVVSNAMGTMLHHRHGAELGKMRVQPCAVELSLFPAPDPSPARQELGITDRFVVCYLGSLEWYQLPDQSIRLFQIIRRSLPNALFLAITTAPETMRQHLHNAGIGPTDFRVVKAPPTEVPRYTAAADIGLLLRENNPVNAVAAPVKFAEYLACGVPVIVTPNVGDCSTIVRSESLGAVVDISKTDAALATDAKRWVAMVQSDGDISKRCRQYAERHLSWTEKPPQPVAAPQVCESIAVMRRP